MPTNWGYCLVARAANPSAVQRTRTLVKVDGSNPLLIVGASFDQLVGLGLIRRYLKAYEQYWPGSVAVIVPSSDIRLEYLKTANLGIAVCISDDPELTELISKVGPLALFNVGNDVTSLNGQVDAFELSSDLAAKLPATVIRVVDDAVEILRPGVVAIRAE